MLPKKLNKETIIDSIVELRYVSDFPKSVIFGIIYNELRSEFPNVEETTLTSIPEQIRDSDPNLSFQALYRVKNDNFVVHIGTDMIAVSAYPKYLGWSELVPVCQKVFKLVYNLGIIKEALRIGIRYINKFEGDISEHLNFALNTSQKDGRVRLENLMFNVSYIDSNFLSRVQCNLQVLNGNLSTILDVDTSVDNLKSSDFDYIWSEIEEGHNTGKRTFFNLLNSDFITSLEPTY